jgi:hypothetical protein
MSILLYSRSLKHILGELCGGKGRKVGSAEKRSKSIPEIEEMDSWDCDTTTMVEITVNRDRAEVILIEYI